VHPRSQQTLSTQKPETHAALDAHALPLVAKQLPESVPPPAHVAPAPHEATAQQTPSVQNAPPLQPADEVHALPSPAVFSQAPLVLQKYPETQSPSDAQLVLHEVEPHV
jgi:hypothetical protein